DSIAVQPDFRDDEHPDDEIGHRLDDWAIVAALIGHVDIRCELPSEPNEPSEREIERITRDDRRVNKKDATKNGRHQYPYRPADRSGARCHTSVLSGLTKSRSDHASGIRSSAYERPPRTNGQNRPSLSDGSSMMALFMITAPERNASMSADTYGGTAITTPAPQPKMHMPARAKRPARSKAAPCSSRREWSTARK